VRMTVAYDGSGFHGFTAQGGLKTVGGALAGAIGKVLGHRVELTCAGRTDKGVHAWGQVVSFDAEEFGLDLPTLQRSLNRMLGPTIVVREADRAPSTFDARYSARARRYRYTVLNRAVADPFLARTAWHVDAPLDLSLLRLSCDPVIGEHDFSSFCRAPNVDASLVRRVHDARWCDLGEGVLRFEIEASAFCHQMVRSLVGTMVAVGRGKKRAGDVAAIIRARDRAAEWGVRAAKSRFLPTLSAQASISAFTQEFTNQQLLLNSRLTGAQGAASNCRFQNALIGTLPGGGVPGYANGGIIADCNAYANLDATGDNLSSDYRAQFLKANNVWPFNYTRQPFQAFIQLSLPIFDQFSRNLAVAQARAQREDMAESVRARELQVETDVAARYLGVQSAYQAIRVQEQSRQSAREQLRLAQDRYRLGSGSSLEVSDAQNNVTRAEGDYVNAIYEYHKAVALLEFAVGRPLR